MLAQDRGGLRGDAERARLGDPHADDRVVARIGERDKHRGHRAAHDRDSQSTVSERLVVKRHRRRIDRNVLRRGDL
ncbi:MAG: hypothetical protein H7138_14365 [Myxococcales bacterium]|nr:hypothetical protein [Myxococcales bacterium]